MRLLAALPWTELVGVALTLGGGFVLYRMANILDDSQFAVAVGVLAFLLLGSLRRVWGWLLGPVLFHDLVRTARQGRHAALRCVYLVLLLLVLFLLYWEYIGVNDPLGFWVGGSIKRTEVTHFAEAYFAVFMTVQFCVAFLLTPIFTAGCVAEEKDRKTLEFLLTTDLGNHEIIFGKLLSRLAALLLLVITGLPVLGILQFLGGVDPNLVLGGFLATGITMLSLASLSIACSVWLNKPRTAILASYVLVGLYFAASTLSEYAFDPLMESLKNPSENDPLLYVLEGFGAGNIGVAIYRLKVLEQFTAPPFGIWIGPGTPPTVAGGLTAGLPRVLVAYCAFHGLVIALGLLLAVLPLRIISRWESGARGRKSFVLGTEQRKLPRVWDEFLEWKELFAEPMFRFNRTGMVAVATFITLCMIFGLFVLFCQIAIGSMLGELAQYTNSGVRTMGTFLVCLLLLGVAIRAAGSIGAERDRLTLESLLTTPAENGDIVWAKWLGCVLGGRKLYWYLGLIWLTALVTGGLSVLGLFLLTAAFAAYATFFASLGLWFSLICRTTTRAYLWTLLAIALLCTSHLIFDYVVAPVVSLVVPRTAFEELIEYQSAFMVPPYTLTWLATSQEDTKRLLDDRGYGYGESWWFGSRPRYLGYWYPGPSPLAMVSASVLGLVGYAMAGMILFVLTTLLFGPTTGRVTNWERPPDPEKSAATPEPSGAGA